MKALKFFGLWWLSMIAIIPFVGLPILSVIPMSAFGWCFLRTWTRGQTGGHKSLIATVAWFLFVALERLYILEWEKTISGAPIRVDLMVIAPLLLALSIRGAKDCRRKGEVEPGAAPSKLAMDAANISFGRKDKTESLATPSKLAMGATSVLIIGTILFALLLSLIDPSEFKLS